MPGLPGWRREGEAVKTARERRASGLLFHNSPFSSYIRVLNTYGEASMSPGHPQALDPTRGREPRVVGVGMWEAEEGPPHGWNLPNQLPPPSPKGTESR